MHLLDGRPVLSASDLVGFLACEQLTQLELAALRGEIARPDRDDPELDVLTRRGDQHERHHLAGLRAAGRRVVEIAAPGGNDESSLVAAEQATAGAMAAGAEVIYQAAFFDGRWRGRADFLQRVAGPSRLGPWSYEPVDTKLARKVKAAAVLQLCHYADHLERLQGVPPANVHVVTGHGASSALRLADYSAYYRQAKQRAEAAIFGAPAEAYPDPVEHCGICRWQPVCEARRRADDHLSLVAGMRRSYTARLRAAGVATVADLAGADAGLQVDIGGITLERLTAQARLQVRQRATGATHHELVQPIDHGRGLCLLPRPSPGDLFFDIEGDPFVGDGGVEYLLGVEGPGGYRAFWGHDPAGEKRAFEGLLDLVLAGLAADPGMHVYHYGSYERTALCQLMGRHATRELDVDRLLRGGVLVDLLRVVRQGVRVSEESYSLKRVEHLYRPARATNVADGRSSIVAYEEWLSTGDDLILDRIAEYNHDDCRSTLQLREWLEDRRRDVEAATAEPLPRPGPGTPDPSEEQAAVDAELAALAARLLAGIPDDPGQRDPEQAATWLLAQLLEYHRREGRPEWWAYFRRLESSDDELVDDADSIGRLTHVAELGVSQRSVAHRYCFPPEQEHKIRVGKVVVDPRTGKGAGTVLRLDSARGVMDLRRPRPADTHPTSVVPDAPVSSIQLRRAVARMAALVADHGLGGAGAHRAVADLLLRRRPSLRSDGDHGPLQRPDENGLAAAVRVVTQLDGACLAVQGPPGSGKTYAGAHMIVALVAAGRRVGITSNSHKAIGNLLTDVRRTADAQGVGVRAVQKCAEAEGCAPAVAERIDDARAVVARLTEGGADLVAGTAWLFARPEMAGRLDTLFVDEAGQFSLANAVAVAGSAANLVLLGDPQQLAPPVKGVHPAGSAASVLQHVLGEEATVRADRGLFLSTTWRLHPDLCEVVSEAFYDGRLESEESCRRQRVDDGPWAGGTGLRFVPVVHSHNRTSSPEEVDEVAAGVGALLGRPWTDRHGLTRPLTLEDILVVAPYNNHVARLQAALPPGARVGTVDRFQGQEATVVIFSLATSSAADLPRSLGFLYSANRLNVAVSRARALAVVVASPALLAARCHRPEQLRLVNALCRMAERQRHLAVC